MLRRSATLLARDIEKAATEEAEKNARKVLATTIQRLASEQTSIGGGGGRAPAVRRHEGPG